MLTVTCAFCGKTFEAKTKAAKYCSATCKESARIKRNRVEMTCLHCGRKFMGSPDWGTKYCSTSCALAHGRVERKFKCVDCGVEFVAYGRRHRLRCDACWKKHRSDTNMALRGRKNDSVQVGIGSGHNQHINHDVYANDKHQEALAKRRAAYKTKVEAGEYSASYAYRRILTGDDKCALCGYTEHQSILVVHHKNMNRSDNSRDNLVVLCPNCHALIHAGMRLLIKRGVFSIDIWEDALKVINTLV